MAYLIFGFSILWVCTSGYVLFLDRQLKDLRRRLDARTGDMQS